MPEQKKVLSIQGAREHNLKNVSLELPRDKLIVFKDPVVAHGADPSRMLDALVRHAESLDVDLIFSMISAGPSL